MTHTEMRVTSLLPEMVAGRCVKEPRIAEEP
jgi:hypothetical protein